MRLRGGLCLLCSVGSLGPLARGQCYDLTSARLYELKGRFQERWDKPIWDAKPGEGNFHLDEPGRGGVEDFAIFTVGQVRKTESGWKPLYKSRVPEIWCRLSPERNSSYFCYWAPFQMPPPDARRVSPIDYDRETWSLTRDGILRFTRHTYGNSRVDGTHDFGSTFEAVLDLNTGAFSTAGHGHSKGHYRKRIPEGVELWRDTTLSARVRLTAQPCAASLREAGLPKAAEAETVTPIPICVVRVQSGPGKPGFEFVINPKNALSPKGCVIAAERPMVRDLTRPSVVSDLR